MLSAPEAVVVEPEIGHDVRLVLVSAIEEDRLLHQAGDPLEVGLPEHGPLRDERDCVRALGGLIQRRGVADRDAVTEHGTHMIRGLRIEGLKRCSSLGQALDDHERRGLPDVVCLQYE